VLRKPTDRAFESGFQVDSPEIAHRSMLDRIAGAAAVICLAACATLPTEVSRTPTTAFADTSDTRLARAQAPAAAAHPGKTGVHALANGRDAFAARAILARVAERSLDVQYYIWHADTSGALLGYALWEAAERGVRVRMLLDDANTKGLDEMIATLDAHPNIEVRLFNPFPTRGFRLGDFATDFSRLNRRMHNKSFTADNQVTIVGGRNIGNEYMGAESGVAFADLDVVATGAVVRDVSNEFDSYWNSVSAYPAASVIPAATPETMARVRADWEKLRDGAEAADYVKVVRETLLVTQLLDGTLELEWVPARVVADDPAKVLNPPEREDLHMLPLLEGALGKPMSELDLVSPYFVPAEEGTAALVAIATRGVKVRVLTNSLGATDVGPVYAGYAKYREELLRGGVRLFELKRTAAPETAKEKDEPEHGGVPGSSGASLHAKTFAVDRSRIFIGSFNLDPRSARLNTEMGVVLDSVPLATRLAQAFDDEVPRVAYEVRLTANGKDVEWIERTDAGEVRHSSTPDASAMRRAWMGVLGVLPIEWLL
jgi:putative cardiolipin synthase